MVSEEGTKRIVGCRLIQLSAQMGIAQPQTDRDGFCVGYENSSYDRNPCPKCKLCLEEVAEEREREKMEDSESLRSVIRDMENEVRRKILMENINKGLKARYLDNNGWDEPSHWLDGD